MELNRSQEVLQILMNLNRDRQITVVLVSHDLTLSAQISDRLLLLHGGRLAASGTSGEVLRPELLSRIYLCDLQIRKDPWSGELQVTGDLSLVRHRKPQGRRVHVTAGGGSGIELYRRLLLEGYSVSTGVLNRLDSDAEAARALDLEAVLEQPFSAVSEARCREATTLVEASVAVVVAEVPFGSGNLINLSLAEASLQQGKPVFLAAGTGSRDYTEGKAAERKAAELVARGARIWGSVHELIPLLQQSLQ